MRICDAPNRLHRRSLCENGLGKRLVAWRLLRERRAMQSVFLLADTKVFGIALNAWKIIGLTGSIIFGLRFLIQWLASERARKSVIPFGFWECSALGSLLTLAYFAIYRHDSVGVLQTALRSEERRVGKECRSRWWAGE